MEKDLDKKLYDDYLNGEKQAFEYLYNKYKGRIEYFINNIVKDYQIAEDLVQETFIYVMQNPMQEKTSFKYYIYLVARSKAYNYINVSKRRSEIDKAYISNECEKLQSDVFEIISKEETKKEVLEAISELKDDYKNAVYLVNIEELTYEETSKILDKTLSNTKSLVHRGKKQLRKILLKKGFKEMNKISQIIVIILVTTVLLSGVVYAVTQIYKQFNTNHNITINGAFQSTLDENTINNLWVGTLDLAWKELEERIGLDKIELEDGELQLVNDLNESTFSKDMLDLEDYEITVERTVTNGYKIETSLNKELSFITPFDNFSNDYTKWTFGDSEEYIKYFGINNASSENMNENIEVLFFDKQDNKASSNCFAIKLKTVEGDEIILYRTDEAKSFDEYYADIETKSAEYDGNTEFTEDDELRVPYVRVNGMISYTDLYEKFIKNTEGLYFENVIQDVNFYFNDTFIIFMKEANSNQPYFALKVDNSDILEKIEEITSPKIVDYTELVNSDELQIQEGETKFYEDENYEYYFSSKKSAYVKVYFPDGQIDTIEWALKNGEITIDFLDEYGVEYIKKEK